MSGSLKGSLGVKTKALNAAEIFERDLAYTFAVKGTLQRLPAVKPVLCSGEWCTEIVLF